MKRNFNESLANGIADTHETRVIDQLLGIFADDYAVSVDEMADIARRAGMTEQEIQAFIYGNISNGLGEAFKELNRPLKKNLKESYK